MIKIACIIGHGLSGSTLLTLLLGAHPEIATVGELVIAARYKDDPIAHICSCGSPYRACPFWQAISHQMKARGFLFDVHNTRLDFRGQAGTIADVALRATMREPYLEIIRQLYLR